MFTASLQLADRYGAAGGKAKNLSILTRHQLPVPDGFVITADAFSRCMETNQLKPENSEDMKEKILNAIIPQPIVTQVESAFHQLMGSYNSVVVRSSSQTEDLKEASFAGQYQSYLHVQNAPELLEKVKACWASLFTPRVIQYVKNMNIPMETLSMGVIVQGLVDAELSGVIFSANPVTNNSGEIMINASYGLGETIVSGMVTPDCYLVDKETFRLHKERGEKEIKMITAERGTQTLETTTLERNQFCLSDRQIFNLANLTKKVETIYHHPVDIEFAIENEQIYLLQVRPITTV